MVKRNIIGLLRLYILHGFYILLGAMVFYTFLFTWQVGGTLQDFTLTALAILMMIIWLVLVVFSIFSLIKQHKQWQGVERARMSPESLSLYASQSSYAPVLQDGDMPLIIKNWMSWRVLAIGIITVYGLIFLLVGIMIVVALISHDLLTLQDMLFLALFAVCMAVFVTLLVCAFALIEYELIEASEHELMMQKGLWRRFVSWEQARLFAVGGKFDYEPEWIELSSAKVILRWPYSTKGSNSPGKPRKNYYMRKLAEISFLPVSRGEYEHQLSRLQGYVRLKTGLPLRDLRR
ncbi:MAG TPA: hypothetical protein VNE38_03000 [Ktedonobacteraceae bacterium]|nr:hypothetical protein [Ktedonobacteraceae bacterium]